MADAVYHERQRLMQCAHHALNNLLQRAAYSPADLDRIAVELGGIFSLRRVTQPGDVQLSPQPIHQPPTHFPPPPVHRDAARPR